jgi:hypothetical protein
MTRAIFAALALTACTQSEPEPCALPERMPAEIEMHGADSVTQAMLESAYGNELDGGTE